MKHEQLSYFDALRYLAKKYNIEIEERELTDEEKRISGDRESMLIITNWAQQYFSTILHEHAEGNIGMRYFKERGFRDETIQKFQLGYSLEQYDALYKEATKKGYKKEYLEKTGLVIAYDDGRTNDRFRGRVMFPIHSVSGKVVGFGGRILKKNEKTAKYVNSPESEIYHKSNELYGLYFAKKTIVKEDKCFLVEGYTDVISMHQTGIENVVASSGTALTQRQIKQIHRFTDNITVLYDGDAAGIKAALRGIDLILEDGMNVKVVLLPEDQDPDSFAQAHSKSEFEAYIKENETDFIRFKTKLLMEEAGNDPIKRTALINDILESVAIIQDGVARSVYIRECSALMDVDERVLVDQVTKIRHNQQFKKPQTRTEAQQQPTATETPAETAEGAGVAEEQPKTEVVKHSPFEIYEKILLRYVVRYGEVVMIDYTDEETQEAVRRTVAEHIAFSLRDDGLNFYTPLFRQMLDEAVAHSQEEGFVASRYFLNHPDPEVSMLATNLYADKYQLSTYHSKYQEIKEEKDLLPELVVHDICGFKYAYIQRKIQETQAQLKAMSNEETEKFDEILDDLSTLNVMKNVLSKELGERIILKL